MKRRSLPQGGVIELDPHADEHADADNGDLDRARLHVRPGMHLSFSSRKKIQYENSPCSSQGKDDVALRDQS